MTGRTRVFSCRLHEESWEKFRCLARQYGLSQADLLEELVSAMPEPSERAPRFVVTIEERGIAVQDRHLRTIVVGGVNDAG